MGRWLCEHTLGAQKPTMGKVDRLDAKVDAIEGKVDEMARSLHAIMSRLDEVAKH